MFVAHWDLSSFHIISAQALALKILWKPVAHHGASVASLVVVCGGNCLCFSLDLWPLPSSQPHRCTHMCQLYPTVRCGYVASPLILHTLWIEGQRAAVQNRLCSVAAWRFSNRACESKGLQQVFESWGVESVNFCQDHLPISIQITGICGLRSFLVTCSGFDQILLSWVCRTVFHWVVMGTKSLWFHINSDYPAQIRCCQYYLTVCKVRPMSISKWLIHVEWLFWLMYDLRIMSL